MKLVLQQRCSPVLLTPRLSMIQAGWGLAINRDRARVIVMRAANKFRAKQLVAAYASMLSLLLILFLVDAPSASAEGRCPPGQYPIGGQGVGGCAPIPGGDSGANATTAPRPTGRWLKTWGAIATAPSGDAGASTGQSSKGAAEKEAISQCARGGASDCRVTMSYKNQCAAMVTPSSIERGGAVTWRAETEALATKLAMDECTKRGSAGCKVFYSACSDPIFQEY